MTLLSLFIRTPKHVVLSQMSVVTLPSWPRRCCPAPWAPPPLFPICQYLYLHGHGDVVPLGEDLCHQFGAQHIPQGGSGQELCGPEDVVHVTHRGHRVRYPVVHYGVHWDSHRVPGQDLLVRKYYTFIMPKIIGIAISVYYKYLLSTKRSLGLWRDLAQAAPMKFFQMTSLAWPWALKCDLYSKINCSYFVIAGGITFHKHNT